MLPEGLGDAVTQPLVQQIQAAPSQPSTVRIGTVTSVSPLTVSVQGAVFAGVGKLTSYFSPAVGDVVALVGQSALTSDAASWLVLGKVGASSSDAEEFTPPQVKAWNSTLVTLANSTTTVIPLQTELWDSTGTMHDTTTNTSRLVAPIDGRYLILANLGFVQNAVGRRICQVRLNAAGAGAGGIPISEENHMASPLGSTVIGTKFEYDLIAGDYVEMFGNQTSGAPLDSADVVHQTWMSMRWMSQSSGTP